MRHADDARALLKQQVAQARQMIRRLLDGRLAVTPLPVGKGGTSRGPAPTADCSAGTRLATTVVAPTGFEPVCGQGHVFSSSLE